MEREKWSSLFWLGVGIFICVGSLRLSLGKFHNPGPGFLSFFAGLVITGLALVVHFQSRGRHPGRAKEESEPIWSDPRKGMKIVMTVVALLVYAVIMNYLGFLISTFLFLAFILKTIEPQRWSVTLIGSLIASAAFYVIFEIGLQSQLPKGLLQIF